jgi:diamine N-acetyltransferase
MRSVTIRQAGEADIPFIMATERGPGFDRLVGRWEETLHRHEMADPTSVYLIGERAVEATGFALLRALDDPFGNILLKRIAVRAPGTGTGSHFLRGVMVFAFARSATYRLWLEVFTANTRARHVYRKAGFREDGILREAHVMPGGDRVSLTLMSIIRPEWEALQRAGVSTQ